MQVKSNHNNLLFVNNEQSQTLDNDILWIRLIIITCDKQPDGKGELRMEDSEVFLPNDYYNLTKESFRLYYTSRSDEQQVIDIYFFDNRGNSHTLSFTFNNTNGEEEEV